ncbi:hypothetical protein Pla123a_36430 [Posidoniimonas polymericola]|uniref:PEP-CTERM protein-sorting domain-containing protein n=1 Tax=Posidoniimonas polymericola TaxID=2528002 RepID=A0A5C5YEH6_9BACT|nr:PEP-CTERM sorting domain-containing protein [Posidoniimonas polymericola]TWT73750.1 hypothetical protein Pla123a_36430 [Posidoniimonas polymericola]
MAFVALFAASLLSGSACHGFKDEIGYLTLLAEYEGTLPDGSGVPVSMVEADADNNAANSAHLYLPDSANSFLSGQTITNGSSVTSPEISDHATNQARNFFGSSRSVAFGVTQVTVYEANDYLDSILNRGNTNPTTGPPDAPTYKVQNHSWVGSYESSSNNIDLLNRFDYLVDTYDVIAPVGLNNLRSPPDYVELFGQSYNGIAVGRSDGSHTGGLTPLSSGNYSSGRVKPDIVSSPTSTSAATASVSSVAAMLYQSATDTANFANADSDAARSEPMKAILMAGATKDEFPGWENSSPTQPLDLVYGAGELNVRNSFYIQQGGQFDGAATAGGTQAADYGWDYGDIAQGDSLFYDLSVPDYHSNGELSVVLAWNIEVTDGSALVSRWVPKAEPLANLDLKVWDSTGAPLDFELATSVSTVDNVEHVYLTGLAAGDYTIEVLGASGGRDFGLAWRLDYDTPYRITGDYNLDGIVDAGDYTMWRDTLNSTTNLAADGDLNGVVDEGDYAIWLAAFGSIPTPPIVSLPAAAAAVGAPEPSSLALLAGLTALACRRRRR